MLRRGLETDLSHPNQDEQAAEEHKGGPLYLFHEIFKMCYVGQQDEQYGAQHSYPP